MRQRVLSWIEYATRHRMIQQVKDFWLLLDYIDGGLSRGYFEKNVERGKQIIEGINKEINGNREVCENILKEIERW